MPIRPHSPAPAFLFTTMAAIPSAIPSAILAAILAVLLTMLCSVPTLALALAGEIEAKSRIVQATVYPNRATMIREAVVDIPAGASVVLFQGLPANLLSDSLRAQGQGDSKVRFNALSHTLQTQAELIAPRERELTRRMQKVQDQRDEIQARRQALAAQRAFLEQIGRQAGQRVAEEVSELRLNAEQWTQAASVIGSSLAEILTTDLAHQVSLRELDRTLQRLKAELSRLQTGQRTTMAVRLPLEADAPVRLTIRLEYQVPGVSWRPVYDARLDTADAELSLVHYGAVRQNTGEDWEDVRLVLSTAQPQRGAGLPDLKPLWVDLIDPAKTRRDQAMVSETAMQSKLVGAMDSGNMAMEDSGEQEAAGFVAAEIRTGGFVTEYVIPGRVNVPADGTESRVLCGAFATDNRLQVRIKPQLGTEAFLVSRATLLGEAPLLPGPASLFRDGAYIGQTRMPLLRPGQEQDIGFGIDDRIAVTRNILKDERSDPTLLSREHQLERHMVTTIANQGRQDVEITVLETVPAPRHDRIKLDISRSTTQGYDQDVDDVPGQLRWTVTLPAGDETRISLGWILSWPRNQDMSGV